MLRPDARELSAARLSHAKKLLPLQTARSHAPVIGGRGWVCVQRSSNETQDQPRRARALPSFILHDFSSSLAYAGQRLAHRWLDAFGGRGFIITKQVVSATHRWPVIHRVPRTAKIVPNPEEDCQAKERNCGSSRDPEANARLVKDNQDIISAGSQTGGKAKVQDSGGQKTRVGRIGFVTVMKIPEINEQACRC